MVAGPQVILQLGFLSLCYNVDLDTLNFAAADFLDSPSLRTAFIALSKLAFEKLSLFLGIFTRKKS